MKYLNATQFGKAIGVADSTVYNWTRKGLIKEAYRTPSGRKMYAEEDVEKIRSGEYGGDANGNRED